MLEAIALQAGYRVGVYTQPHLVHFEERCRIDGADASRPRRCCRTSRRSRRRAATIALTYFEFTTLAILRLLSRRAARPGDPRGRPRRPARRGQRHRRRLRRHHQHRPRPHRVPRARTARRIGREKAGILRAGRPAIVSDPLPPQSVIDARRARSAPTCGCSGATSTSPATSSSGAGPGAAGATAAWPIRRCAAPTSCSMPSGVLAALEALRERLPVTRAGGAQRPGDGRAAGALPDRARPADAGARRRAQPACGRRAGAEPRPDGLLSRARTRCSARWRDKDLAGHARDAWRRWSTAGTSPTCRRRAPPRADELAAALRQRRADSADVAVSTHASPLRSAARRGRPPRTPLIESSSSDRSTPWAAC